MSNLHKQIRGEWVQMTDGEEERMWSARRASAVESLRSLVRRFS